MVYGHLLCRKMHEYVTANETLGHALHIAWREKDTALEMWALASAADVDGLQLHARESRQKSLSALELAPEVDDPFAAWLARLWAALSSLALGDSEGARLHAGGCLSLAEGLRTRVHLLYALWVNALVAQVEGNWREARGLSNRSLPLMSQGGHHLGFRALLEFETGEFTQGHAYLELLVEVMRLTEPAQTAEWAYPASVIPLVATITGIAKQFDIAESAANAILSAPHQRPVFAIQARVGLALIAVQSGDVEGAAKQYVVLESQRSSFLFSAGLPVDRILGLLAGTMGKLDEAMTHFEDAFSFCRKAGYRPALAWTCCDYADLLLRRASTEPVPSDLPTTDVSDSAGHPELVEGWRQKGMSLLDESLSISRELGMRPLMERVLARRELLNM